MDASLVWVTGDSGGTFQIKECWDERCAESWTMSPAKLPRVSASCTKFWRRQSLERHGWKATIAHLDRRLPEVSPFAEPSARQKEGHHQPMVIIRPMSIPAEYTRLAAGVPSAE